jgi:hypothetical protein
LQARLIPSTGQSYDRFGTSVDLAGGTALVGAVENFHYKPRKGSAYVFRFDPGSGSWIQEDKLRAQGSTAGDGFGVSSALSAETALVGASWKGAGGAYVYRYNATSGEWDQEVRLKGSGGQNNDEFGESLDLCGNIALVGIRGDDDNGTDSGSAIMFRYDPNSTTWNEEIKLLASDGAEEDSFGLSVAFSRDRALVGAPNGDDNGVDSGSAYLFDLALDLPVPDIKIDGQDGPLSLPSTQNIAMTISLDPAMQEGVAHDWWIGGIRNSAFLYCWVYPEGWTYCPNWNPTRAFDGPLVHMSNRLIHQGRIPKGSWLFTFVIDELDNNLEGTYIDTVEVTSY